MSLDLKKLTSIGWGPFFQQQLSSHEWENTVPFRVMAVHRGQLILFCGEREISLSLTGKILTGDKIQQATVGDWLLLSRQTGLFIRLLSRKSLFKRKAAGTANLHQLVAANVDTLFIVTSCNDDFNLSRLERYLALAFEAEVTPVIVLTKMDLSDYAHDYLKQAESLDSMVMVEAVNALAPESLVSLRRWCKAGQTIAFMGSSGVGKSTLVNSLGAMEQEIGVKETGVQKTARIREGDAKGRHTTTHRSLLCLRDGALLLDSPGMRELQISDCGDGVSAVFPDIEMLSRQCRFKDCNHGEEPNCAVLQAIEDETLLPRRLISYKKLMAEQWRNAASLAERRKSDKAFGKLSRAAISVKKRDQRF